MATSTKTITPTGARVTTVAAKPHASAGVPGNVTLEASPGQAVGLSFNSFGVSKVAPGSQAARLSVVPGWRLVKVAGKAVTTPSSISAALVEGRKGKKKYALEFVVPTSSESTEDLESKEAGGEEEKKEAGGELARKADEDAGAGGEEEEKNDAGVGGEGGGAEPTRTAEEDAAAAAAAAEAKAKAQAEAEAEAEAARVEALRRGDGEVVLKYEMYDERFPIKEEPEGTFRGLLAEETYWVYVIQDKDQEAKDREQMRQTLAAHSQHAGDDGSGGGATERPDDGRGGMESCSCIYGNPCVDEYGCKDWHNRFAIAKKNGWKGF